MTAHRVGVVGIGTLGVTVAQLVLDAGGEAVLLVREGADKIGSAERALDASLAREVNAGRLARVAAADARRRAHVTDQAAALSCCDIVIECLPEVLAGKRSLLAHVERHLADGAIFASATSSIPAAAIGAHARRPGRVAVAHFVWPANRSRLVEVAFPEHVDADVAEMLIGFLRAHGKHPLVVRDVAGFLVTRAVMAYWSETVELLAEGVSPVELDTALEGMGWPIGACRLLDGASISTAVSVAAGLRGALLPALLGERERAERGERAGKQHGCESLHGKPPC